MVGFIVRGSVLFLAFLSPALGGSLFPGPSSFLTEATQQRGTVTSGTTSLGAFSASASYVAGSSPSYELNYQNVINNTIDTDLRIYMPREYGDPWLAGTDPVTLSYSASSGGTLGFTGSWLLLANNFARNQAFDASNILTESVTFTNQSSSGVDAERFSIQLTFTDSQNLTGSGTIAGTITTSDGVLYSLSGASAFQYHELDGSTVAPFLTTDRFSQAFYIAPEPGTLLLMGGGLILLRCGLFRFRRRP